MENVDSEDLKKFLNRIHDLWPKFTTHAYAVFLVLTWIENFLDNPEKANKILDKQFGVNRSAENEGS